MSDKSRQICSNRRARHEYHLLEVIEAGLMLQGTEVKSLRAGKASIKEAFGRFKDGGLWLMDMHIPPYEQGNIANHDPTRPRKLLLNARELRRLRTKVEEKGLTLVPLRCYFNARGWAKIEIALARGKKQHDKRHDDARRDAKRAMDRARRGERE